MRPSEFFPIRSGFRFTALGVLALSASACSQTDRFAYDPFSNPFNGRETTGSVSAAPVGGVSSQPLPPPGGYQSSSYTSAPAYAPQNPPPPPAPYQAASNYTPPPAPSASLPQYSYNSQSGWTAQGGKTIVVKAGDTPYGLGAQHGVPASAILDANRLQPGAALTPGQRLVIPSYNGKSTAAAKPAAPATNPAPVRAAQAPRPTSSAGGVHTVQSGETLFSIARTYNVAPGVLAQSNSVGLDHRVRIGEKIALPGGSRPAQSAVAQRPAKPTPAPAQTAQVVQPAVYKPQEQPVAPVAAVPQAPAREKVQPAVATTTAGGGTDFRWPVRGRVISGFGAKPDGKSNDGVNISVPEGTEIRAAEGGVVAYAGNELKGFGNLVLIRHAGEWVTAYAHASEIMVKRGDVVRRGQVIAKAGKSGNVTTPQLHFEVRRGASPVDPLKHLPQG